MPGSLSGQSTLAKKKKAKLKLESSLISTSENLFAANPYSCSNWQGQTNDFMLMANITSHQSISFILL